MHRRHAVHAVLCTISAGKDSCLPGGLVNKMFSGLMSAWTTPLLCIKAKQPCRAHAAADLCVGNCQTQSFKDAHATRNSPYCQTSKAIHMPYEQPMFVFTTDKMTTKMFSTKMSWLTVQSRAAQTSRTDSCAVTACLSSAHFCR